MPTPRLFTPRNVDTGVRVTVALPEGYPYPDLGPRRSRKWVRWAVPDGTVLEVRRAPCGLGCDCDAEYRRLDDHRASRA